LLLDLVVLLMLRVASSANAKLPPEPWSSAAQLLWSPTTKGYVGDFKTDLRCFLQHPKWPGHHRCFASASEHMTYGKLQKRQRCTGRAMYVSNLEVECIDITGFVC
jgi:hypothetical protein